MNGYKQALHRFEEAVRNHTCRGSLINQEEVKEVEQEYEVAKGALLRKLQYRQPREGVTVLSAKDAQRISSALTGTLEALTKIEGGSFPNASTLAINGQWHEAFEALQQIARDARAKLLEG